MRAAARTPAMVPGFIIPERKKMGRGLSRANRVYRVFSTFQNTTLLACSSPTTFLRQA